MEQPRSSEEFDRLSTLEDKFFIRQWISLWLCLVSLSLLIILFSKFFVKSSKSHSDKQGFSSAIELVVSTISWSLGGFFPSFFFCVFSGISQRGKFQRQITILIKVWVLESARDPVSLLNINFGNNGTNEIRNSVNY